MPRPTALAVLAIAALSLIASSWSQPNISGSFSAESTFDETSREQVVDVVITLDPATVRSASGEVYLGTFPQIGPDEMPIDHPLKVALEGDAQPDISSCLAAPGRPCTVSVPVRLTWTGSVPASVSWQLDATALLADTDAFKAGGSVTVKANAPARVDRYLGAAVITGLLLAIAASVVLARAGAEARRWIADALPAVLAVVVMATAAYIGLVAGPIGPLAYERELALILAAQAAVLAVAYRRRISASSVTQTLAAGSVLFASLPTLVVVLAVRPAYRPLEIVFLVAVATLVAVLTFLTRDPLVGTDGRALGTRQRAFVLAQITLATGLALTGVLLVALEGGWNAWFDQVDSLVLFQSVGFAFVLIGLLRWLRGRSRMLTLVSGALVLAGPAWHGFWAVVMFGPPWLPPEQVILGRLLEPAGFLSVVATAFGLVGILGRRLRPEPMAPATAGAAR